MLKRVFSSFMCFCFVWTNILGLGSVRAAEIFLPEPGTMLLTTSDYVPVMMRGLQVRVDNPLLFDFIIDTGNSGIKLDSPAFKDESEKLIKYFLASLTVKEEDLWVNLSPYEKDRMITQELGTTVLGRDMLAQDYVLKQLTASMIYPEKELGKAFWDKVYAQAKEQFGTTDIPVDTFNKVWITADKAKVLERNNAGYVIGAHLKVMLESDYIAQARSEGREPREAASQGSQELAKQVVREIVLPAIEKEVNEGKNFSNLRQIFYAMILASWYKAALKDALLNQVYADKGKMDGVQSDDPAVKERIYARYLEAYKKGVFNYIREEADAITGEMMPRKYFSGGVRLIDSKKAPVQRARKLSSGEKLGSAGELAMVSAKMDPALDKKRKMTVLVSPDFPKPQVEVFKKLFPRAVFVENLPVNAGDDTTPSVTNVLVSAYGPYDVVLIDKNSYADSYSRRFRLKDKVITAEMIEAAGFNAQNNFDPQNILDLLEAWDVVKKDEGSNVQGRVIFGDPKWTPAQEQRELQIFLSKKLSEDPEPGIAPEAVAAQAGEIAGYIMDFLNGRKRAIKVFTNNITAEEIKTGLTAVQTQVEKAMGQGGSMSRRGFLKLLGLAAAAVTVLKPVVLFASDLFDYVYTKALPYIKLFQDNALTTGTADFPDVKGFTRSFRGDGPAGPLQLYGASSYDMAGLARVQLQNLSADSKRDTTILDTFVTNWKKRNNKVFNYNNGYHDANGNPVNNLPYNMIRILGRDIPKWWESWDWNVEQGGSAELITLATDAFRKTGNDEYRQFAKAMIDALLPLQDTDGGFRFGPIGIAHDSGDRFYWNLKSTEKNQRIYSAIQNFNAVFEDPAYVAPLAAVKGWINSMYNKEEHLFRTAAQWNGTAWVTRPANEYFATDVTAMAPGFIFTDSRFGATQEERDLEIRAMVEQTETRTAFKNAAGMPIFFRFSGSQTGDYGSVEWTSQMAFFYLLAANFYDNLRIVYPVYQSNFEFYYERYRTLVFSLKNNFLKPYSQDPSLKVAPYASYLDGSVAGGVPTGTGFMTPSVTAALVSSVWFAAVMNGFDMEQNLGGPGIPQSKPVITAIAAIPGSEDIEITMKDPVDVTGYDVYSTEDLNAPNWTRCATNVPASGTGETKWRDKRPRVEKRFYRVSPQTGGAITARITRPVMMSEIVAINLPSTIFSQDSALASKGKTESNKLEAAMMLATGRIGVDADLFETLGPIVDRVKAVEKERSREISDQEAWKIVQRAAEGLLKNPGFKSIFSGSWDLITERGKEEDMLPKRILAIAAARVLGLGYKDEKALMDGKFLHFTLKCKAGLRAWLRREDNFQDRLEARARLKAWLEDVLRISWKAIGEEHNLPLSIFVQDAVVVAKQESEPYYVGLRLSNDWVIYFDILKEFLEIQKKGQSLRRISVAVQDRESILREVKGEQSTILLNRLSIKALPSLISAQEAAIEGSPVSGISYAGLKIKYKDKISNDNLVVYLEHYPGTEVLQIRMADKVVRSVPLRIEGDTDEIVAERVKAISEEIQQGKTAALLPRLGINVESAMERPDVASANGYGGIDLNAKKMGLDVEKTGQGIQMKVDPAMVQQFQKGDFSGVTPVILQITPIASPAAILGLKEEPVAADMSAKS